MKVREVMATVVHSCQPQTNLAEAGESMWSFDCGALQGFLSVNDLVLQAGEAKWKGPQGLSCEDVLQVLKEICGHRALVGI